MARIEEENISIKPIMVRKRLTIEIEADRIKFSPTKLFESMEYGDITFIQIKEEIIKDDKSS